RQDQAGRQDTGPPPPPPRSHTEIQPGRTGWRGTAAPPRDSGGGNSLVVAGRRGRIPLPLGEQLILVVFAADLGPCLLEDVRPGDVRLRRRIGRRRHLVRVVVVEPGLD